jgi:Pentapeptide repeats (8 copies)
MTSDADLTRAKLNGANLTRANLTRAHLTGAFLNGANLSSASQATTVKGKPYNNAYCMVFRFANGKIQEIMEYLDTELINSVFS